MKSTQGRTTRIEIENDSDDFDAEVALFANLTLAEEQTEEAQKAFEKRATSAAPTTFKPDYSYHSLFQKSQTKKAGKPKADLVDKENNPVRPVAHYPKKDMTESKTETHPSVIRTPLVDKKQEQEKAKSMFEPINSQSQTSQSFFMASSAEFSVGLNNKQHLVFKRTNKK